MNKNIKLPFKYRLSLIFFCIVVLISAFLGIFQYEQMKNVLNSNYSYNKKMLRDNVISAVKYADKFYHVVEMHLEPSANKILASVAKKYATTGQVDFDLAPFVKAYKNFNITIINSDNRVVAATDETQLGLNYNNFYKYVDYFKLIRKNGSFVADRFNIAVNTSDVKKACYLPSADKKYIFCIEIKMKQFVDQLHGYGFDNFDTVIDNKDDFVDRVVLYNSDGDSYKYSNFEIPSHINFKYIGYLAKAIKTNKTVTFEGIYKEKNSVYEYIPYQIIDANGINKMNIIELVYNDDTLQRHLRENLYLIFWTVIIGAGVSLIFGFFFTTVLTRPLARLNEATKKISKGDFDVVVGINTNDEVGALSKNFDKMAAEISTLMEIQKQKELDLQQKNKEIFYQNEEISALYEETAAMNEELAAMNEELGDKNEELEAMNTKLGEKNEQLADMNEKLGEKNEILEELLEINKRSYLETVSALASAIEAKDNYTGDHSLKVKEYSIAIASELGLDEQELKELEVGSLLHDIGKIGIPEAILNKQARFTDEEYEMMKKHPTIGHDILKKVHLNENSKSIVYEHHERFDGKGYPQGLAGDAINYLARIVCVADAYHAMTSSRPYRKVPLTLDTVIAELEKNKGTQFDPVYVDALVSWLMKYEKFDNETNE